MGKPETRRLAGREIAPVSDTAALPLPLVWDTTRNPLSWPFRALLCLFAVGVVGQGSEHADLLSGSDIWLHLACGIAQNLGIFRGQVAESRIKS